MSECVCVCVCENIARPHKMVRGKEFFRMLRDLLFEEELDEEDVPLPAVIVEDNPEWLELLAKT